MFRPLLLSLFVGILLSAGAQAQAQQLVLRTSVFSAGAQQSTVGNLVLQSTVGQPFVYSASNSNLEVQGGFWPSVANAAGPLAVPTAADDAATTVEDGSIEIDVLANDTDPASGALTIVAVGSPDHGQVSASGQATLIYTPDADYFGEDGFTYTVQNEQGGRSEATVTITILPVNDAPVFTSSPILEAAADRAYRYLATATDVEDDARAFTAPVLPAWLALAEATDSTVALVGTPTAADVGVHDVTLAVSDGQVSVEQTFTVTVTVATNVSTEDEAGVPEAFALHQNYPNPFNPKTTIAYDLPQAAEVRLTVYDLFGRAIKTLIDAPLAPDRYEVSFQADGLASGTYFYRVEAGAWSQTRQFILLK